jgi:RNA polymerase sigma-70 factor (ECF subfamily)
VARKVREPFKLAAHPERVTVVADTDEQLAVRARAGDVVALAGLLERYRASLYGSAISLLRNRDDALDAVQETYVIALARFGSLRDPAAVGGWLHAILRNACYLHARRLRRETLVADAAPAATAKGPEELLEAHALRDWVWAALDSLSPDDRLTAILRYFSRSLTYHDIAAITAVPVGTVRSRLNRVRSQLALALRRSADEVALGHADDVAARRSQWEHFYATLHDRPTPKTYHDMYVDDVTVTDAVGRWTGVNDWSNHEREAILLGVRARIVDLFASRNATIIEIDFINPAAAPDHCPPRSTFVHRLVDGRSQRLSIQYV